MKLSVIIVSYNVKHYLEQCLLSLLKAERKDIPMEIFIVDNASQDNTPTYIRERFPATQYPNIHFIANARNVGFGKANNQAIAKTTGEYILFLNPDTIVTENTLHDTITFADRHPQMGGLGTMMLHSDGNFANESRRGLPTPWAALCKMSGLCALFPKSKTFGKYYMQYLDKEKTAEIEIISGAFFLVRKSALDKIGLFDEAFFMYGEDIDLSYRLLKEGYKNYYTPSPILHYKGESTQKSTFRYVHIFYTAMLIFFKKHFHHYGLLLTLPIKIAIILRAIIAITAQYITRTKEFLFPRKEAQNYNYIYVGRNTDKIKAIADEWCLDITIIEGDEKSRPEKNLPHIKKNTAYVIYDTENFSYSYILDTFRHDGGKAGVGTFYPHSDTIVTHSDIFTLTTDK